MNAFVRPIPISRWQLGNSNFFPMPRQLSRVYLAEGRMSAPAVSASDTSALGSSIDAIISTLTTEIQAVQEESDLVSPAAIRADPTSASEISFIGQWPPQEIRSELLVDARSLGDLVNRVQTGALSAYVSSSQAQTLSGLKSQVDALVSLLENQDTAPIASGDQDAESQHLAMHVAQATQQIQDAEKAVVGAEAGPSGAVPVLEPLEKGISLGNIAIGVGIVAVAGLVLWQALG